MGLFNNKNPNETAFTGGKKHWADVIKNTGPGELLIWRQPEEDFNSYCYAGRRSHFYKRWYS